MAPTLRDENCQDELFLLDLYATSRAQEMAAVPWSSEQKEAFLKMQFQAQHDYYKEKYSSASFQIVVEEGVAIGRLYVLREPEVIRILDITIIEAKRGKGVGTQLLQRVLDEATQSQRPVEIYVETVNPSLRLFERLGFSQRAEEGFNFLLEWRPAGSPGQPPREN